jgi:hypothetical protein
MSLGSGSSDTFWNFGVTVKSLVLLAVEKAKKLVKS